MAKRYKEEEVIALLKNQMEKKKMLFMPNCGCGLTAKLQEKGGADLICVSATSYWRMKGQGSLAPLMPYCDINEIIMELAPEIVANVSNAPILSLSGGTNPLYPHKEHLQRLWDAGISGINPFMMKIYGDAIMEQMAQIDMGWEREVDFVGEAHKVGMFSLAYAFTPEEATILAEVGCPAIASHVGSTVGGMKGAKSHLTLDEATEMSQRIFDAAKAVNPDVILFAHGGPMKGPKEAAYVVERTDAVGFIGGSAAERMPIEKAVLAATEEYKEITL
ncbi:phosphoenolpyruvate hydrolase family protein [Faecalicatena contorta]|uniref:Predicted TIM-barrel enzyme n=1 Tax=Faecalicatena contorta TaxID=39482 RepID=A0A315ZQ41_9FIRM|nr:phosphoenolpyruvate hydrolase family protein [Faecalicatena contorta]PWJ47691.1 putative TIM-barrel enzyme [Faecalicatena contorta]SUQ15884.1 Predicted TIM-barrel enzyme [Faecalicatena contorta]